MKRHPICRLLVTSGGQVIGPMGKELKPWISNGYRFVRALFPKTKSWKIARLVAETYIENPENKPEVNHKDGDKLNDNRSNLEWSTRIENANHSYRIGLQKARRGDKSNFAKLTLNSVKRIRQRHKSGISYSSIALSYNVTYSTIRNIIIEKTWKQN